MKYISPILLLLLSASVGGTQASSVPSWLKPVIDRTFPDGKKTKINPPAAMAVYRYKFKGKEVYYIPPRCCDIGSVLFTSEGKILCSPDGGMTGRGDGKCPDFFETRSEQKRIWPE